MNISVQDLLRKHEQELLNHPDVQAAITEITDIIRVAYPDAQFHATVGDDSYGVYIMATVDVEDADEVRNLYRDRIFELQVEDRIPIYVMTLRPPHRWAADGAATVSGAARATG